MSTSFGVLEIPTLTKITWELYSRCRTIAKDAPDGFRGLVTELGSLQGALRALSDDFSSNTAFFERMNDARRSTLGRCLSLCLQTLQRLTALLNRYRELGILVEGKKFWQEIQWITQRPQIEEIKSKIMVHTSTLSLCMSSIDNTALLHLEKKMLQAIEDDEQAMSPLGTGASRDTDTLVSPLSLKGSSIKGSISELEAPGVSIPRPRLPSLGQISTQQGTPRPIDTSSESTIAASDASTWGKISPTSPLFANDGSSSRTLLGRLNSTSTLGRTERSHNGSIDGRSLERTFWDDVSEVQEKQSLGKGSDSSVTEFGPNNVTEAVSSVMQQLQQVRLQEQAARPLRYVPQNKIHKPDPEVARAFQSSVNEELQVRRLITRDWIRVATWWLLKARATLVNCSRHASQDGSSPALLTDENRKSISDLSEIQPEETSEASSELGWGHDHARWITVNQEDGGTEEERVIYRTFVNAGIGAKTSRLRTRGAPYLLLLATKDGESEPKIIICNQSGSLCLQRDFEQGDLPPLINLSNAILTGFPGTQASDPIPFKFDSMSVSISFQFDGDLGALINIPKSYFDAVKQREPIDSPEFTESVVFKGSVEVWERLKAPGMKPMNSPQIIKSGEVRILEKSFAEAWQNTRRVVISPSAAETSPRCIEFWMPLSRVQIHREDMSRQVLMKWSDTTQERSDKTDGSYNTLYSHMYDSSAPNIGMSLHFGSQKGAEDFEKAVLDINFKPVFSWSEPLSAGRIYDVVDANTDHKQYKAVTILQKKTSWRYIEVCYLYRNADFDYSNSSQSVRFPAASYTDYISTHVEQLFPADHEVGFSHCDKRNATVLIEFNDSSVPQAFLSALAPTHDLIYSRRIVSLTTKSKSPFGKKSNKGYAEIQLWRRTKSLQLAARWDDSVANKWITMALPPGCAEASKDNTVNIPKQPFARGTCLDMLHITAKHPKDSAAGREGAVTIAFQRADGKSVRGFG
ncbi:hypothetical protein N7468_006895 [Penicillium chermesinum]|uniref:Fungal N-terminal domain-containing protein n=1 Tax=Penicillium chermesinum TaxID=63820 RepID=A0A9W9NT85_9EURO|nr:uncharacterized protein N7468_006895 [Penicillium chermesinum]KAJ5225670.1 hypothetical protein N7468_006895 [Penicillium chermesinum]